MATVTSTADVEVGIGEMQAKQTKLDKDNLPIVSIGTLLQFATPRDKTLMIIGFCFEMGAGVGFPLMFYFFGDAVDALGDPANTTGEKLLDVMLEVMGKVGILAGAVLVAKIISTICIGVAKEHQSARYKVGYLKSIVRQDIGWFDCNNPQELSTAYGEALLLVEKGLGGESWGQLGLNLGQTITGFAISLLSEWRVGLLSFGFVPIVLFGVYMNSQAQRVATKKIGEAYAKAGGVAAEALGAVRTVASLAIEDEIAAKYDKGLIAAMQATIDKSFKEGLSLGIVLSATPLQLAVCFMLGLFLVREDRLDSSFQYFLNDPTNPTDQNAPVANGGPLYYCTNKCNSYDARFIVLPPLAPSNTQCRDLDPSYFDLKFNCFSAQTAYTDPQNAAFFGGQSEENMNQYAESAGGSNDCELQVSNILIAVLCSNFAATSMGILPQNITVLKKAQQALVPVQKTLMRIPPIDSFNPGGEKPDGVKGHIEVKEVVFAYPSAPHFNICNGYNLNIPAGAMCALCGPSGSGKSTIVGLMERFYDPQAGSLHLDGHNLKDLNVRWLRAQMSLVGQEPVLFSGTVYENIAYGVLGNATREQVEEAAKTGDAHNFITKVLADGYDTDVGQGGGKLSGGQKQRVAIARAMIKKPEILLLDEATSALDNAAEKAVQTALDKIRETKKRTTITIAHRLTTIRNSDIIAVVNRGVIVEQGNWEELCAMEGGLFRKLAEKQQKASAEDAHLLKDVEAVEDQGPPTAGSKFAGLKSLKSAIRNVAFQNQFVKSAAAPPPSDVDELKETLAALKPAEEKEVNLGGGATSAVNFFNLFIPSALKKPPSDVEVAEMAKKPVDTQVPPHATQGVTRKLFKLFNKEDYRLLYIGAAASFITGGTTPASGLLTVYMLLTIFYFDPWVTYDEGIKWALILAALAVCQCCATVVEGVCYGKAAAHLTKNLRSVSFAKLIKQEVGFFDFEENSAGELTAFLAEKVTKVQSLIGEKIQLTIRLVCGLVLAVVLMFVFAHWAMTLIVIAGVPLTVAAAFVQLSAMGLLGPPDGQPGGGGDEAQEEDGKRVKSAGQLVGEVVKGIKTVCSFNAEEEFYKDYAKDTSAKMDKAIKKLPLTGLAVGGSQAILVFITAINVVAGAGLFKEGVFGDLDTGTDCIPDLQIVLYLLVPIVIVQLLLPSLAQMASTVTDGKEAQLAAEQLFERLERTSKVDPSSKIGEVPPNNLSGHIVVTDVIFAYPTRAGFPICNGYNLEIPAGYVCALCGPSGSGKSTIINLVQRFYDPSFGSITIDGYEVTKLRVQWLRSQIGLVGQEPVLFIGTVLENIAQGKIGGATREEVEEAAKAANAYEFITTVLGDGFDTQVGLGGGKLSGGQKQRVAIARALVRKPAVLLLDEATSALDNESEKIVQAALDDMMAKQKKTTITIAHRLSTIRGADLIAVINRGKVVERGNHTSLLQQRGIYFDLVQSQAH